MADPHDKEIYKRPYNRPNENWVCGKAAEGRPCPHGPSRHGRCTVGHACIPAQVGDRWVCTRPEQYGGPCDSPALENPAFGPAVRDGVGVCCTEVHCTPQRSLRSLRGRYSVILSLGIVGVVLIALGGTWRDAFLSPGPLTLNHQGASMAALERMEHGKLSGGHVDSEESCHICHTRLEGGLEGLVSAAFKREARVSQSSQCLVCHQEDVGENALYPHGLDTGMLALHTEEAMAEPFRAAKPLSLALAAYSPGVKKSDTGQLACAACHREHNGTFFDIKRIDNQKCQTCHVKQFKGIDAGHPDFSTEAAAAGYDYPYRRRTRIIYDHERHETNYFQKEENRPHAPADCTSCHEIEGDAFATRLKPFAQMCASCHTSNIVSSRDAWTHVFGFPSLESDVYEILEDELALPPVPRTAAKSMSNFMVLLLAGFKEEDAEAQATFSEDLAMLQEYEGDLSGIAYDEDPEIVGRIFDDLAALRGLAMDGEQGGFRGVMQRQLENLMETSLEARELDAMFGFPKAGATVEKVIASIARKDIVETAGWHVQESGFRLDSTSWMATIEGVESYVALMSAVDGGDAGVYEEVLAFFSSYGDFRDWFKKNFRVDGEDWIFVATGKKAKNKEWKALITAMLAPSADDTQEGEADESSDVKAGAAAGEDEDVPASESAGSDLQEVGDAFVKWLGSLSKVKKWLTTTVDVSGEHWTLRAPRSLYYRPTRHADPFTTAWLNFTASLYAKEPAAAMVFDELSGRATGSGVGACMKCHSIDVEKNRAGAAVVKVNWKATPSPRDFTKFKHAPHLKLMNCAECHRADWVPAVRDRMTVAASAEEEVADDVSTGTNGAATAETPSGEAPKAPSAMSYLDSFKASDEGLELGVNFSNSGKSTGSQAFVSNFEHIAKDACTRCHVEAKAGNSCLICHNYHIEEQSRSMGIQSLRDLITKNVIEAVAQ